MSLVAPGLQTRANINRLHQHLPQFPEPSPDARHRHPGVPRDLLERQAVHEMEDGHRPARLRVPPEQPVEQQPGFARRRRVLRRGNRRQQRFFGRRPDALLAIADPVQADIRGDAVQEARRGGQRPAAAAVPGRERRRPGTRRGPLPRFEAVAGSGGAPSGRTCRQSASSSSPVPTHTAAVTPRRGRSVTRVLENGAGFHGRRRVSKDRAPGGAVRSRAFRQIRAPDCTVSATTGHQVRTAPCSGG